MKKARILRILTLIVFFALVIIVILQFNSWKPAPIFPDAHQVQIQEFENPKRVVTTFEVKDVPKSFLLQYGAFLRSNNWYSPTISSNESDATFYYDRYFSIFNTILYLDKCPKFRLDIQVSDMVKTDNFYVQAKVTTTQTENTCNSAFSLLAQIIPVLPKF